MTASPAGVQLRVSCSGSCFSFLALGLCLDPQKVCGSCWPPDVPQAPRLWSLWDACSLETVFKHEDPSNMTRLGEQMNRAVSPLPCISPPGKD